MKTKNIEEKSLEDWKKEILAKKKYQEKFQVDELILEVISIFQRYRKENNLTQAEFAEILETSQQAISRLERNLINPSLGFLVKTLYKIGYKIKIEKM